MLGADLVQRRSALGAGLRHFPGCRTLRPAFEQRPDDLRDDVAGASNDDRIAYANLFEPNLPEIMEGDIGHRDAAHKHWF